MASLWIAVFIWFASAVLVASLADRRGRSFWVYLVMGLVLPPAAWIAGLYLLAFGRRWA